jgi:hypothetical protein
MNMHVNSIHVHVYFFGRGPDHIHGHEHVHVHDHIDIHEHILDLLLYFVYVHIDVYECKLLNLLGESILSKI